MLEGEFPELTLEATLERLVTDPRTLSRREQSACKALAEQWLHFFTVFVLGYDLFGGPGTFHWRQSYELQHISKPTLVLWFREAFKTTLFATARPLWRAANDPEHYDEVLVTWDPMLGKQRMRERRKLIENRPQIEVLFPDMLPSDYDWSDHSMSVRGRSAKHGSPTYELRRIKQSIAGRHVQTLTVDDLVNEDNMLSATDQEMLRNRIDNIWPTLQTDELLFTGTLYTDYDLYAHLIDTYYPRDLQVTIQPVRGKTWLEQNAEGETEIKSEIDGPFAHPGEWDEERYAAKKRQMPPFIFYCQYHLDTSHKGERGFNMDDVSYVGTKARPPMTCYMGVDPASGTGSSKPAIMVVGVDPDMDFHMLYEDDAFHNEAEFIEGIFATFWRFSPAIVGMERYGQGGHSMEQRVRSEMRHRAIPMKLNPMTGGKASKKNRIRTTLRPLYQDKRIKHSPAVRGGAYEGQLKKFPDGKVDDLLDAAVYAVHLAQKYGFREAMTSPDVDKEKIRRVRENGDKVGLTLQQLSRHRFPDDEETERSTWW
jgi:hypothetical protein